VHIPSVESKNHKDAREILDSDNDVEKNELNELDDD